MFKHVHLMVGIYTNNDTVNILEEKVNNVYQCKWVDQVISHSP